MKLSNKKIMSLILSGAMVTSVAPVVANAASNDQAVVTEYNYLNDNYVQEKQYNMAGLYRVMVGNKPVYVYLGNEVKNDYLSKAEALHTGVLNYENVYVYSKTVNNPNYIKGVSPYSERTITIYALSGNSSEKGWTRINEDRLGLKVRIATSIELGEFLLKGFDLSSYQYNMMGFGNADINKDGISDEIIYLGNNEINALMTKEDAIRFGMNNYTNYYIQSRTILNPDFIPGVNSLNIKVYAISDRAYVPGWTRINKSQVPAGAMVASNVQYMNALVYINSHVATEVNVYTPDTPNVTYNSMVKDKALEFAYSNYSSFCIMFRVMYNPLTKTDEVVYAFSFTPYVEGWTIIGNDNVPSNASIFLTMVDAYNYEFMLNNNASKTLRPNK